MGKSPCLMDQNKTSVVFQWSSFHSYAKLPEGFFGESLHKTLQSTHVRPQDTGNIHKWLAAISSTCGAESNSSTNSHPRESIDPADLLLFSLHLPSQALLPPGFSKRSSDRQRLAMLPKNQHSPEQMIIRLCRFHQKCWPFWGIKPIIKQLIVR